MSVKKLADKKVDPARIVADNLESKGIICCPKMRGPLTPRYMLLNSNDIFKSLVELYDIPFQAQWNTFSELVSPHSIKQINPVTYLARVYISHWFMDLYVSIKDACLQHECVEVSDYYDKDESTQSNHYDCFLTALLESMKPTHIKRHLHNALYIPLITTTYRWNASDKNVFNINNFTYNPQLFKAFISKIKDPSTGWHTAKPSNDPLGRPCWLFDWHYGKAYAWFPEKDNYNNNDVCLAFIIGVPCTPLMSISDRDFPQQFPQNIEPDNMDRKSLKRVIPQRCWGNIDVRTIEKETREIVRPMKIQVPAIEPGGSSGQETEDQENQIALEQAEVSGYQRTETVTVTRPITYRVNLFTIVDYLYYACVLRKVEINVRSSAHRILTMKD